MSVDAQTWVWKHSSLTGSARLVLLRIADQANSSGADSWPGIDTMAEECRVQRRAVQRAIRQAEEAGELLVFEQAGGDSKCPARWRPNRYDLPRVSGWQPPSHLVARHDPAGHMAASSGVSSETPRKDEAGVSPTTPRTVNGVSSTTPRNEIRGVAGDQSGVSPTTPNPKPYPNKDQNHGHRQAGDRFDEWISVWPKHKRVKLKPTREIWRRKKLDRIADQLIEDVHQRLARDRRWKQGYIPDPTTYLNQQRWEDAIDDRPSRPEGQRGGASAAPGQTPADRNREAAEQYRRGRDHGVVAADE